MKILMYFNIPDQATEGITVELPDSFTDEEAWEIGKAFLPVYKRKLNGRRAVLAHLQQLDMVRNIPRAD